MGYGIFLVLTLAALGGFYGLVEYEARRGVRFAAPRRERFDTLVRHTEFILDHVDFAAFIRDTIHDAVVATGHFFVSVSLRSVRAVERLLTRIVRSFRSHQAETAAAPRESSREFVKALSDFKETLKATPGDISDITE